MNDDNQLPEGFGVFYWSIVSLLFYATVAIWVYVFGLL